MTETAVQQWLLDLIREFSPKVVPLDVDENGLYSESETRWGLNPVWAAVPRDLRLLAGAGEDELERARCS